MYVRKVVIALLLVGFMLSCSTSSTFVSRSQRNWQNRVTPPQSELAYRVFLIGDAGAPSLQQTEPSLNLLKKMTGQAGKRSAVVFLGDNLYPEGLPDSTHPDRALMERKITEQLDAVKDSESRILVIPGNHDWANGKGYGLEQLRRQEAFVEAYLDRGNTFIPDDGFPGPIDIKLLDEDDEPSLGADIRLIAIDTQWWLHNHEKPFGDTGDYDLNDAGDFLTEMEDVLRKRRKDYVIVAAHHPILTNGAHGGRLPPSAHLRPPVFGTFYALYRRFLGLEQDIIHHKYREYIESIQPMLSQHEDLVYVSGHDHNLQYFRAKGARIDQHYIVSGSGSKTSYSANGRGSDFNYDKEGFATIQYYKDGSVWAEFWAPVGDGSEGELVYRTRMKPPKADIPDAIPEPTFQMAKQDSAETAANPAYDRPGKVARLFIGEHNRKVWSVPVKAPVFKIGEVEGGLTAVRLGGRGQSNSLHLEGKNGRKYVLRSIDKVAGKVWDEKLKRTFARKIAQDQFSIIQPYAAFVIPKLADAAKIYHTNPKLYYIPEDPALGEFGKLEAGKFALFEEKPDGDMSHEPSMGRAKKVLSYRQFIREIEGDVDHRMDQPLMARSRLFDMWIGDWDRHFDQWRWAEFEPEDKKGKIYRPIPRDRDVAFMRFNRLPTIAKLGPFFQYQQFIESYGNLKGLTFNSLGLTRRFTNNLTKEDWVGIAKELQESLTDEIIERAVLDFPPPIYERFGAEIIHVLKVRRDKLDSVAEEYFGLQNKVVSIPGSNKREEYLVERLDKERTRIRMFKVNKEGERKEKYYDRIINKSETKEVRLYGLGGDDIFTMKGDVDNKIRVLAIGGSGDDEFIESTRKKGGKDFRVYDTKNGNIWKTGSNTRRITSNNPRINRFDYEKDFLYNRRLLVLFFGGNSDDGALLGGGVKFVNYEFRREPASSHVIKANGSPSTSAFNVVYNGSWAGIVDSRRLTLDMQIRSPESFQNFFGLGNETEITAENISFYRAELAQFRLRPAIHFTQLNALNFSIGPSFLVTDVELDPDRFVNLPQAGIAPNTFKDQWFTGVSTALTISDVDAPVNPKQGFRFSSQADLNFGVRNTSENYARLNGSLSLYLSPRLYRQFTIANRIGAAHNIGEFPFYESNTLGGTRNLRGFRGTRFSGRSSVYHNIEVRAELFSFYRYLLGGRFGVNAFLDTGRVWTDGENSRIWHQGYGGGLWFNLLDAAVLNFNYGLSEEDTFFNFGVGFFF